MRTKTLVLSAVCAVAGSLAVNAQSVYSVNAVGYVNVTAPQGFSILCNPLIAGTNTLSALLPNPPDQTVIYEWSGGTFQTAIFYADSPTSGSWDNDLSLAPGVGAWIFNPTASPLTITFVGEVPQGTKDVPISVGFSLVSSVIPQAGQLDTTLGFTPNDQDVVYQYQNGTFLTGIWYADSPTTGSWDNIPVIGVGEGFWVFTSTAKTWTRTFNITN